MDGSRLEHPIFTSAAPDLGFVWNTFAKLANWRVSFLGLTNPCKSMVCAGDQSSVCSRIVLSRYIFTILFGLWDLPARSARSSRFVLVVSAPALFVLCLSALVLDSCWCSVVVACSSLARRSSWGAAPHSSGDGCQQVVRSLWRLRGSTTRAGGKCQLSLLVKIG